jgi:transcriptional regulator with XRE-family HTH domain
LDRRLAAAILAVVATSPSVGELVREWRRRRRLSQLGLALMADVSARHLSFVETGRARPSRGMVLHLAERLEIPFRHRNELLLAAGYAPAFAERRLDDPAMDTARAAVERLLAAHEPYPALAVDRHWNLVAHNRAVTPFLACMAPGLLQPPVNVLRLSLHPEGMAKRIENLAEWREHVLRRLRRQVEVSADPVLVELLRELHDLPVPTGTRSDGSSVNDAYAGLLVPLRLATPTGPLTFVSTTTVFGTPVDITLAELALETFFPADEATAAALRSSTIRSGASSAPDGTDRPA